MNYWEDKKEFWRNKTEDNPAYKLQKQELLIDVVDIILREKIERVIDVGGYTGIVGKLLEERMVPVEYQNLDFRTGVDITKPWEDQIELKSGKRTLAITSLTLLCLPPEDVTNVLKSMQKYADHLYLYEEAYDEERGDGEQLNDEYGGKWTHDWERRLKGIGKKVEIKPSAMNKHWVRITI